MQHMRECYDEESKSVKSLLLRIVHCSRIEMYGALGHLGHRAPNWDGRRLYFMVTENVFYQHLIADAKRKIAITNSVQERDRLERDRLPEYFDKAEADIEMYDLKGSWVNRSTVTPDGENKSRAVMKDNDLREKLYMNEAQEKELMGMLKKDSEFLRDFGIMDYSLLLGIRQGVTNKEEFATLNEEAQEGDALQGAYRPAAVHSAQCYYMGIIDILQEWYWDHSTSFHH